MNVEEPQEPEIPVTILTGFLGAGKTTLLNRILKENHNHKIAIIENEFGTENVDNDLLVTENNEQIVSMNNGCVCCTIRGDLSRILTKLRLQRDKGEIDFDYIVLETSGGCKSRSRCADLLYGRCDCTVLPTRWCRDGGRC